MSVEIPMPRLSQTTDEVKLIRWLVAVGDLVAKGQALCEVENDKTTMEVESFAAGTVLRLAGEPESMISAGTVIAVLGETGERAAAATPAAAPVPAAAPAPAAGAPEAVAAEGVLATPLVRNLARKRGVDLTRVHGTGARGLITRADLEAYVQGAGPAAAAAREVPLSAHQRAVARAVTAAKTQVPHYYLKVRVGADRLRAWRGANGRADGRSPWTRCWPGPARGRCSVTPA
jgi:pyruvate dehydrogenase E2 component (dihydrolipoamide acetyltransferase)